VIGTSIYNFGIPSTLKAFLDHISRSGTTFIADETGIHGQLGDKKIACFMAAGGDDSAGAPFEGMDHLTPHLSAVFRFPGITDLTFIEVWPTMHAIPQRAVSLRQQATDAIDVLARKWSA